jgi:hypothetical protein
MKLFSAEVISFPVSTGCRIKGGTMKKLLLAVAVSVLMLPCLASAKARTFTGEIMDSSCAQLGSHAQMMKAHPNIKTARECTLGCVKAGAKFVLFNPATKTIYQLDNQKKPEAFAGEKVRVTGTYDTATKTIHVVSIRKS